MADSTKSKGKRFGEPGHKGGRPKGVPNKFTQLKAEALKAWQHNGGWEAFAKWGAKPQNQGFFYKIIFSLVPKDVKLEASVAHTYDPATVQELGDLLREATSLRPGAMGKAGKGADKDRPLLPH